MDQTVTGSNPREEHKDQAVKGNPTGDEENKGGNNRKEEVSEVKA